MTTVTTDPPAGRERLNPAAGAPYAKDLSASATILGFASVAWLAWGSTMAPDPIAITMGIAMLLALALGVWSILLRRKAPAPSLHHGETLRSWWVWFAVEFGAIAAGNVVLGLAGHYEYAICWTYLVMSLHFIPLGRAYRIVALAVLGALGAGIALAGAALQGFVGIPSGPVVGGLGALAMIACGVLLNLSARVKNRAAHS